MLHYRRSTKRLPLYARGAVGASVYLLVQTIRLDGKNRINCVDEVSVGSLNQSIVHPRELFKTALLSSAAAIILVHNHPSGDSTPSREDIEITRRIKEAGEILGVKLLDHIVIGSSYLSFTERGLL